MSKYGEFEIVRTERHKPKKATDNVDEDGMREYSFLKCPHCQKNDIEIVSSNLVKQKSSAIKDHIMVCTEFKGERPTKRKVSTTKTALVPFGGTEMVPFGESSGTEMVQYVCNNPCHDKGSQEWEDMKRKVKELEEKFDKASKGKEVSDGILAQHQIWWGDCAMALGMKPPQDPPLLVDKVRRLREMREIDPEAAKEEYRKNTALLHEMIQEKNRTIEDKTMMIKQKDEVLMLKEQAWKDQIATFQRIVDEKELEFTRAEAEKAEAERERNQAMQKLEEATATASKATETATSASARAEKLKKERDTLRSKLNEHLKATGQFQRMSRTEPLGPSQWPSSSKRKASELTPVQSLQYYCMNMQEANKRTREE
jgi:hypothetical protein